VQLALVAVANSKRQILVQPDAPLQLTADWLDRLSQQVRRGRLSASWLVCFALLRMCCLLWLCRRCLILLMMSDGLNAGCVVGRCGWLPFAFGHASTAQGSRDSPTSTTHLPATLQTNPAKHDDHNSTNPNPQPQPTSTSIRAPRST